MICIYKLRKSWKSDKNTKLEHREYRVQTLESVKNFHSNKFNFIYQLWAFRDVDLYNVYIYKQYTVNQLEFVCEKFLRGLRESRHRKYFSPSSSNKMSLVFYFLENPHLNYKPVLSLVNHKIKLVRIKVGLQYTNGKELSDRKEKGQ